MVCLARLASLLLGMYKETNVPALEVYTYDTGVFVLCSTATGQSRPRVQVQLCSWNGTHLASVHCRG